MTLEALHRRLDFHLQASSHAGLDDQNGIFLPSGRAEVQRVGLALEAAPDLCSWAELEGIEALFLHRPWGLSEAQRRWLTGADIGVLAYHLAFDERLTTGFNPALASACGWDAPQPFGAKAGRPLGMDCALPRPMDFAAAAQRLREVFGGLEEVVVPDAGAGFPVVRAAVVGAMTDVLVREAHTRGVGLYATGQWRQPAGVAVRETGLGVVVIGHRRSEEWGLRTLCRQLSADGLAVRLAPEHG